MLDYLVTSRTRRTLLHLLWAEGRRGSVSALARASGVNFSAVHRELDAMKEAGLALAERLGPALEFRANREHPHAGTLLSLLALPGNAAPLTARRAPARFPASSGGNGTRSTTAASCVRRSGEMKERPSGSTFS
jgi:hypothetical protein